MSENLSRANFRAANSRMNGLYFFSVLDVRLDANAIGCRRSTHFPAGVCVRTRCDRTAPKPSI
ncbi:hypothetical protein HYDPIDRAFT_59368, partial [Hydnomerulius pinastri MD-312]